MNERNLRVLEFSKIRDMMAALAVTDMGRECCRALAPSSDPAEVRRRQAETEEAATVLAYNGSNPMAWFTDVREALKRARVGATLSPKALLAVADALKPDAAACIRKLKAMGISKLVMLTGDNTRTARAIGQQLGIPEIRAELLPQDKLAHVEALRQQGRHVTFVGDGINDSPALTAADTGIAMGSGTDAAMDCSDVVLMRSDLESLVTALSLARQTRRILRENILIAVGTVLALLVGLFAGYIHMSLGMLIHEGSILLVIFNAMRITIRGGNKK